MLPHPLILFALHLAAFPDSPAAILQHTKYDALPGQQFGKIEGIWLGNPLR